MDNKSGASLGLMDPTTFRGRVRRRLGGYSPLLRWYRRLRPGWLWQLVYPHGKAVRAYIKQHGFQVRHGPFIGLRFPREAVGRADALSAKLLGCYEPELGPALEQAVNAGYALFVDLGSGEGYYTVGFKLRSPATRVIGYEADPIHRHLSERVAQHNGVAVEYRGFASHGELAALPPGRLFLMSDIEGYEVELLDPIRLPRLREATMIVECHDHPPNREVTETLQRRFCTTHDVEVVEGQPKRQEHWSELEGWPAESAHWALTEGRSGYGRWLVLKPR